MNYYENIACIIILIVSFAVLVGAMYLLPAKVAISMAITFCFVGSIFFMINDYRNWNHSTIIGVIVATVGSAGIAGFIEIIFRINESKAAKHDS